MISASTIRQRGRCAPRSLRRAALLLAAGIALAGAARTTSAALMSEYYLTDFGTDKVYVLQGTNIVRSWSITPDTMSPIAVKDTVRLSSINNTNVGREYSIQGLATGVTFPASASPPLYIWDGTTDGTYNYTVDYANGNVLRYDANWANPSILFTTTANRIGIAYDPTNNSLWLGGANAAVIEDRQLNGTLISSIPVPVSQTFLGVNALALDPADQTLWYTDYRSQSFRQVTKTGTLVSSFTVPSLLNATDLYGGEFAIPEPGALSLAAIGSSVLLRRKTACHRLERTGATG